MFKFINFIKNILKNQYIKKINKFILKYENTKKNYEKVLNEFGINLFDIININFKDYYKVLNISYTNNIKEIRNAYLSMMKQYHPDINKNVESEERSKDINEAYSVLKDTTTKNIYDTSYKKDIKIKLEKNTIYSISNNLINNYYKLREQDIIYINNKLSAATTKEEVRSAIYEFANWEDRFERAKEETFKSLFKYKKIFSMLHKKGKKFAKNKYNFKQEELIKINNQLESLINTDKNLRKAIENVSDEIKNEISKEEDKVKKRLYKNFIY